MLGEIVIPYEEKNLIYSSISIDGTQQDTLLSYTIKQVFTNLNDATVDIGYFFPNEHHFCMYDSFFIVDGKEIKPQLRIKEEAQKEFDEAKDAGHHTMLGKYIGNGLCYFALGNLPANKTAEIHLKVSFLADVNENGYIYKVPLTTKYQEGYVTSKYINKPNSFHFSTKVKTTKEISELIVSSDGRKNIIDPHNAEIVIESPPDKDAIIIETKIKDEDKNIAISSDGIVSISTYPYFQAKIESNSEFYFIVDCSGSMSGSRIQNAVSCMRIFIQSLPVGCRFSIIKFGGDFTEVFAPHDYTDENVATAMKLLDFIKANMGGTDILAPLEHVSKLSAKEGFIKQIFLLTDGEVFNTDTILATVQMNRSRNRIFTIGLGSGADPGLIKGIARKSFGNYVLISDNDNISAKVIELLSSAISPALTDISIQAGSDQTEMWPSPCPPLFARCPQNFIIKSPMIENILISGNIDNEQIDFVIPVSKCEDNFGLKQLYSRFIIDDYESSLLLNNDDAIKDKCIELSLSSGVLCKYTSYIGVDYQSKVEPPEPDYSSLVASYAQSLSYMTTSACPPPEIKVNISDDASLEEIHLCYASAPRPKGFSISSFFSRLFHRRSSSSDATPPREYGSAIRDSSDSESDKSPPKTNSSTKSASKENAPVRTNSSTQSSPQVNIPVQNVDGSWNDFQNIDKELEVKYGRKAAATVAVVAFIRRKLKDNLTEYTLIIKKAIAFLMKIDSNVDWEDIINKQI